MVANWIDSRCDSILESIARTGLQLRGLCYQPGSVGMLERIDLVVEDIVALETDGNLHLGRFEKDRRAKTSASRSKVGMH